MQAEQKDSQEKIDTYLADQQYDIIRKEVEESGPLLSEVLPLDYLEFEFIENQPFLFNIHRIKEQFTQYRQLRRDGSCFYRAYIFSIFERILNGDDELLKKFKQKIIQSKKYLTDIGFEEFAIDDFYNIFLDLIKQVEKTGYSVEDLMKVFCNKEKSDSLVLYTRFLTSGYIKTNAVLYEAYLDVGQSVDFFCQTEVEPIDRDTDQIQITAIVNFLEIPISIVYLDANLDSSDIQILKIPEDAKKDTIFITFLYRPGHYDILYT